MGNRVDVFLLFQTDCKCKYLIILFVYIFCIFIQSLYGIYVTRCIENRDVFDNLKSVFTPHFLLFFLYSVTALPVWCLNTKNCRREEVPTNTCTNPWVKDHVSDCRLYFKRYTWFSLRFLIITMGFLKFVLFTFTQRNRRSLGRAREFDIDTFELPFGIHLPPYTETDPCKELNPPLYDHLYPQPKLENRRSINLRQIGLCHNIQTANQHSDGFHYNPQYSGNMPDRYSVTVDVVWIWRHHGEWRFLPCM